MNDVVFFPPDNPTKLVGKGSKLEKPEIQPVFSGAYWADPQDSITPSAIVSALKTVIEGPYLAGLKQYGFISASVRDPVIDTEGLIIPLTAPGPNVNQFQQVGPAVVQRMKSLMDRGTISNFDDNHDLFVLFFLDPQNPPPQTFNDKGVVNGTYGGANGPYVESETLDDDIRFQYGWVNTWSRSFDDITSTMAHELVEGVTDPFKSGWENVLDSGNEKQICDMCNQPVVVNGIVVPAYWSEADQSCIAPLANDRHAQINQALDVHREVQGPSHTTFVDLGRPLCAAGEFSSTEFTYENRMTVRLDATGYERPDVVWQVNGQVIPLSGIELNVPATWDLPPEGKWGRHSVRPAEAPLAARSTSGSDSGSALLLSCGPHQGNIAFTVECIVKENFDVPNGATTRRALLEIDFLNQRLQWDAAYEDAKRNCEHIRGLKDGGGVNLGPPRPGDPPDLANILAQAVREAAQGRLDLLSKTAEAIKLSRPELSQALTEFAGRASSTPR